jgi:NAD(P)H-hydrate epimerase
VSRPEALREIPGRQLHVYRATDGKEIVPTNPMQTDDPPRLIIDALLGYSAVGSPREPERSIIQWVNRLSLEAGVPIVSLDLPSGLDATTGETPGPVVHATTTLTLALPKQGLLEASSAGKIQLADIGIPVRAYQRIGASRPFHGQYRIKLHTA